MSAAEKRELRGLGDATRGQALLLDAATALLASPAFRTLLPDLYARVSSLTGLEVHAYFEERPAGSVFYEQLSNDDCAALRRAIEACPPNEGLGEVSGAPEPLRAVLIAAGLTRYVCNPLMHEGRRLGTLVFATRAHHDTAADAPELVHELGALVAMALARDRAEHALAASAADYHQLFQSVDEGMCTIEMIFDERGQAVDYRFLEVNPMFESQTGLRDAVGHTIRELVPDLDGSWPRIYGEVALTGESRRFENHEPAMHRWFDVYAMRIGDPEDRRVGLLFRDVSDRKNREMSLAFLADLDAELAALSSGEQILNAASQRIAEHLGFFRLIFAEVDEDAETLRVFHEWRDSAVPSGLGVFRIADFVGPGVVEVMKTGQPAAIADIATDPRTADRADNYAVWGVRAHLYAPHLSAGRLKFILAGFWQTPHACRPEELELMSELSTRLWLRLERAWTEDSLRESERRFRTIADTAPVVLWMSDEDAACTFLNRSWTELTGQPLAEGLGRGWHRFVHPDDREATIDTISEAAKRRQPFALDSRLRSRDGSYRWTVEVGTPRYDHEGRWIGYIGSITDVHDRKLAEERLREADRRKDHFMAVLSHELRNPLAPIKNSLHLLDEVDATSETALRARRIIKRQVDQLVRLVDDLLDLTRVTRGTVELHRERLELDQLVRHTVEDHRSLFETKGVHLHYHPSPDPILVDGDPNRLTQAVGNLLLNAAKFTSPGQSASVVVARDRGHAVIRVTDTGLGMERTTVAELFQPFIQADASLARAGGGLGLGLTLVHSIVELHGGEVTAHSAGLGRGSEFEVRLPLAGDDAKPAAEPPRATAPRTLSILIIEDSVDVAESMQMLLEMEGHEVSVAHDGVEGVAKARATSPDVVLCDLGLPKMNGYAVARSLVADLELANTLLVAISGYALPEDVERSMAAGFHHHLAKPVSLETLRTVLADVASHR